MPEVTGVVLAGGRGTRLHPVTADGTPKALVPLFGEQTLLSMTQDRLVAATDRQLIVTHRSTADRYREHAPDTELLVEPVRRDTGPAVAHAISTLYARDPEGTVVVTPADHLAGEAFTRALTTAVTAATQRGVIVLMGVTPTRTATGYGYIEPVAMDTDGITAVTSFHEKPDPATADALIQQGALWNTGVLVAPVRVLHAAIRDSALAGFAATVLADPTAAYAQVRSVSVDVAVLEGHDDLWVLPVAADWEDVGSWDAFARMPARDLIESSGPVDLVASEGVTVLSDGPTVAAVGVEDLIIVAWDGEVLVVDPAAAQRVRGLADR